MNKTIDRETLEAMAAAAVVDVDGDHVVDLLQEFCKQTNRRRPADLISPDAGGAAYLIMRDLAKAEPLLTKQDAPLPAVVDVPEKIALSFTFGLYLGAYLAAKGEAEWPTKKLSG